MSLEESTIHRMYVMCKMSMIHVWQIMYAVFVYNTVFSVLLSWTSGTYLWKQSVTTLLTPIIISKEIYITQVLYLRITLI